MPIDCTSISPEPFSSNFTFMYSVFSQTGTMACFGSGHLHSPSGTRYLSISQDPLVRGILMDCSVENNFGRVVSFLLSLPMPGANGCAWRLATYTSLSLCWVCRSLWKCMWARVSLCVQERETEAERRVLHY